MTDPPYRPVPWLFNGHLETIVPSVFRKIEDVVYTRERLELKDGDFLDLDWIIHPGSGKLVILSHGLEGSSDRHYVKGMARYLSHAGWSVLAWNCRSCSGEMNRLPRLYHHGASDDLKAVIHHALEKTHTQQIILVGFSMGGSLSIKYLGEAGPDTPDSIKGCITFSVPCDLGSSARQLDKRGLSFYRNRFLKKLGRKILAKARQFPELVDPTGLEKIKYFEEFDERYTAPLHGFQNAADFYDKASALHYIPLIKTPTCIVNALNDPMLPEACYPYDLIRSLKQVQLETPSRGGHVGFPLRGSQENWMEQRTLAFAQNIVS